MTCAYLEWRHYDSSAPAPGHAVHVGGKHALIGMYGALKEAGPGVGGIY